MQRTRAQQTQTEQQRQSIACAHPTPIAAPSPVRIAVARALALPRPTPPAAPMAPDPKDNGGALHQRMDHDAPALPPAGPNDAAKPVSNKKKDDKHKDDVDLVTPTNLFPSLSLPLLPWSFHVLDVPLVFNVGSSSSSARIAQFSRNPSFLI